MFAGKTIELVKRCRTYAISAKKCVIIRPDIDTRATNAVEGAAIYTHAETDLFGLPIQRVGTDQSTLPSIYEYDVIGIDEGQFMLNLDSIVRDLLKRDKIVIIAALNGKFDTTPWLSVSKVIPLCDEIKSLKSICSICGKWTATTTKLRDEHINNPILIGGAEKYMVLCVPCRFGAK